MTDILLAAYVIMPAIIIAAAVAAIIWLKRSDAHQHRLHPGE